jgi:trigger factor
MQVSVEDLTSVKKVMHIEVPQEEVAHQLDEAYKDLKKTAKLKGFRPGKTPRAVLERHYKKSVNADISQKLIQDSFTEAIQETGLKPVGSPYIDPPELDEKAPFKYSAVVEIAPELNELDYKGIELSKTLYQSTDKEIDAQLKMIQQTISEKETVTDDRPLNHGDFAIIDYKAFKDDKPVPQIPPTENFTLKVGSGIIHKDLDSQLVGMKTGESKKIIVTFPENKTDEFLSGATITFDVTLKEIREVKLHEINDAFAKKLGTFENLDALKTGIRDNLKEGYEKRTEHELNEQIFQALLAKQDFEVPEFLINLELSHIISDIEKRLETHDKSISDLGSTREQLAEKHRETAIKQVKRHLLLNKLIEQEKLELSDEEMETAYEEMAKAFRQPASVLKTYYETNPEQLNFFKHALLEKKAIKLIIDNSIITEKEPELETRSEIEEDKQ